MSPLSWQLSQLTGQAAQAALIPSSQNLAGQSHLPVPGTGNRGVRQVRQFLAVVAHVKHE